MTRVLVERPTQWSFQQALAEIALLRGRLEHVKREVELLTEERDMALYQLDELHGETS